MAESTSRRPERSRYDVPLRLDELHGLERSRCLAVDQLLLQLVQQRIVVLLLLVLGGPVSRTRRR